MSNGLLKHIVALQADGVEITFRFQHLVKLREGKGGIGPKEPHPGATLVSGDDRGQNLLPAIGAVDIALAQGAVLKIAKLVEHKEGMIAFAPEVTVPGRAFLIAVGGANGPVHVQGDPLWRRGVMPPVNPLARKIGHDLAHERITRETLGVIDVWISSKPPKGRLPQKTDKRVTALLATLRVLQ